MQEERIEDDGLVFWPQSLGEPEGPRLVQTEVRRREEQPPPRRRRAMTVLFVGLFFAGAALTAAAGNEVATLVTSEPTSTEPASTEPAATDPAGTSTTESDETTTAETATTTTETVTTEAETTEPSTTSDSETTTTEAETTETAPTTTTPDDGSVPAEDPQENPAPTDGSSGGTSSTPSSETAGPHADAPTQTAEVVPARVVPVPVYTPKPAKSAKSKGKSADAPKHGVASLLKHAPEPEEVEPEPTPGVAPGNTRWIEEPLPDPTPPSLRLTPEFALELTTVSSASGVTWEFVLAVLRAEKLGRAGQVETALLDRKAEELATLHTGRSDRKTLEAYSDNEVFVERVLVLKRYYRAIGIKTLVKGLVASKDRLAAKILSDPRIEIYPGGREDISSGREDVRVLAMIEFLAESFGDVRVSCLFTGHRLYARPGVISAHIYGRGLDIGALDERSIYGNQEPGGITEKAVRRILLLPAEVLPEQVISLIGLGGPSFPLADHADHIHIGY